MYLNTVTHSVFEAVFNTFQAVQHDVLNTSIITIMLVFSCMRSSECPFYFTYEKFLKLDSN